jgi:O-antigen ligase
VLRFDHAMHWAIICGAFSWGLRVGRREAVILSFAAGVALSGIVAGFQDFAGFNGVLQLATPAGLFANKNLLGEAACLALVSLATEKTWREDWALRSILIAILCLTLVMTGTRSTALALFCVLLVYLPSWARLSALLSSLPIAWFALDHATLNARFTLWSTFRLSWFGNGDWWWNVTPVDDYMHNDWLQLLHELGVVGLAPLGVVLGCCLICRDRSIRSFCVALFAIASFGFPLQMPATGWFAAFMLGTFLFKPAAERGILCGARLAHV